MATTRCFAVLDSVSARSRPRCLDGSQYPKVPQLLPARSGHAAAHARANHTKIDISMYVRERLHEDALKEYLQARGGSSIDVLATIADLDEVDMDIVRVSPRPAQLRRYSNREWLA